MLSATGRVPVTHGGIGAMQSARPRDFGMLFLVVAMFLVLLIVSATLGSSSPL